MLPIEVKCSNCKHYKPLEIDKEKQMYAGCCIGRVVSEPTGVGETVKVKLCVTIVDEGNSCELFSPIYEREADESRIN